MARFRARALRAGTVDVKRLEISVKRARVSVHTICGFTGNETTGCMIIQIMKTDDD